MLILLHGLYEKDISALIQTRHFTPIKASVMCTQPQTSVMWIIDLYDQFILKLCDCKSRSDQACGCRSTSRLIIWAWVCGNTEARCASTSQELQDASGTLRVWFDENKKVWTTERVCLCLRGSEAVDCSDKLSNSVRTFSFILKDKIIVFIKLGALAASYSSEQVFLWWWWSQKLRVIWFLSINVWLYTAKKSNII